MLRAIRRGVFETNSSSTHSITICSKEEYDKWERGELLFDDGWRAEKDFVTREEAIEKLKKNGYEINFSNEDEINEALRESEIYTSEQYFDSDYLENFESTYTTKNGETVVAFGMYGYDG